jgi:L-iditol 2-dehydrogenase
MLGTAMGARVIAVDLSAERLEMAKAFGADAVIDSTQTDPVAAIHELTQGEGAEATMDCTGVSDGRVAAVRSAGTWGRVALVGEGGATAFDVSRDLLRRQLTIHASWTFSAMGQAECARFVVDRKVPLKRLLSHRFKLEEAEAAYKLFDTQTTGKGVFTFD